MSNCPRNQSRDQFKSVNKSKTYGVFDSITKNVRTLVLMTAIVGTPAVVGGCALIKGNVKTIEKPPRQQGVEAFDGGNFLLAWRKLSEIPKGELTEDDKGIMEDVKKAILKEIEESLKKGKEAEESGNYIEALQYYERAYEEMGGLNKGYPEYQEATKKLVELDKKIAEYKEKYFQIKKGLDKLFESGNYIALAYAIDNMDEIRASLNYDKTLEKDELLIEICLKKADSYLKKFEYKEALIFFRLAQELLLPGQSIPENYRAKSFAAQYRHEKKLGMQKMTKKEKINTLVSELKTNPNEERKIELAIIIVSLEPKNKEALKMLKKKGISTGDVLTNGGIGGILVAVEGIEISKPKRRRRRVWRKRKNAKTKRGDVKTRAGLEELQLALMLEKVDIENSLEEVNQLLDTDKEVEAIDNLKIIVKKYKKENIAQAEKLTLTLDRLIKKAEEAFTNEQAKKAIRYYRVILLLDSSNARAKKQVEILEGLVQEADGM